MELEWNAKLFDDDSVKEKLTVMSKWDAMIDDGRNPTPDFCQQVESFLQLGKRYQIKIEIKEVN